MDTGNTGTIVDESAPYIDQTPYLDQTDEGRSGFFAWVLGFAFLIGLYFIGVLLLLIVEMIGVAVFVADEATDPSDILLSGTTVSGHLFLLSSFLPFIGALWIVQKKWHKRPWRALITGAGRFRWRLLFVAGFIYTALLTLLTFIQWLFAEPGTIKWVYDASTYWPFLLVTLMFVPFQAASEELLLRGYLGQWFARFIPSKWLVYGITSALFASLHFYNPEAQSSLGFYMVAIFTFGLIACVLTHFTNGLEAAMGVHIFNNIFVFSGVSYDLPDTPPSYLISLGEFSMDLVDTLLGVGFELAATVIILKTCRPLYDRQFSSHRGKFAPNPTQ